MKCGLVGDALGRYIDCESIFILSLDLCYNYVKNAISITIF